MLMAMATRYRPHNSLVQQRASHILRKPYGFCDNTLRILVVERRVMETVRMSMNNEFPSTAHHRTSRHEINNRLGTLALAIEILQQNPAPDVRDLARKMESELQTLQRLLQEMPAGC